MEITNYYVKLPINYGSKSDIELSELGVDVEPTRSWIYYNMSNVNVAPYINEDGSESTDKCILMDQIGIPLVTLNMSPLAFLHKIQGRCVFDYRVD